METIIHSDILTKQKRQKGCLYLLNPMSDQDRISPNNIKTIYIRQTSAEKNLRKILIRGLLVDSITNSPHLHRKKCMIDSKETWDFMGQKIAKYIHQLKVFLCFEVEMHLWLSCCQKSIFFGGNKNKFS